jgi:hypothetical protein
MSLRYGIPPVDPKRRICYNCQHFCKDINPHSGWGSCDIGLNGGLFWNHVKWPKPHRYMAYHTNGRYYTQKGCKTRFISNRTEE